MDSEVREGLDRLTIALEILNSELGSRSPKPSKTLNRHLENSTVQRNIGWEASGICLYFLSVLHMRIEVLSEKENMSAKSCSFQGGLETVCECLPSMGRPTPHHYLPSYRDTEKDLAVLRQVESHDKYFTGLCYALLRLQSKAQNSLHSSSSKGEVFIPIVQRSLDHGSWGTDKVVDVSHTGMFS